MRPLGKNKTRFTENIVRLNGLDFGGWVFKDGMRFGSAGKWWGGTGVRGRRHNGLDVRYHKGRGGEKTLFFTLPEGTKIPLIYPGRVVKLLPDFLAWSIFVETEEKNGTAGGKRPIIAYGHLEPAAGLKKSASGPPLAEGAVIGAIRKTKNSPVPAHLHISIALVPEEIAVENLSWKVLDETPGVVFLDPERVL